MDAGFTVQYEYRHSGHTKNVYWAIDLDEARGYAAMLNRLFPDLIVRVLQHGVELKQAA